MHAELVAHVQDEPEQDGDGKGEYPDAAAAQQGDGDRHLQRAMHQQVEDDEIL